MIYVAQNGKTNIIKCNKYILYLTCIYFKSI